MHSCSRKQVLNYEEISSITILIEVRDNGFGQLRTTKELNIVVIDVNEAPLVPLNTIMHVLENSKEGTFVGTVTTTDPEDDTLSYRLMNSADNVFRMSKTGSLFVNKYVQNCKNENVVTIVLCHL